MKTKEALVYKLAFPKLPVRLTELPVIFLRMAYIKVIKKVVSQTLMTQAAMKAFRSNKMNFRILQMI